MSIPDYVQPTQDFDTGYALQANDWNSNIDNITSFFNTVIVPALNSLSSGWTISNQSGNFNISGTNVIYVASASCNGQLPAATGSGAIYKFVELAASQILTLVPNGTDEILMGAQTVVGESSNNPTLLLRYGQGVLELMDIATGTWMVT